MSDGNKTTVGDGPTTVHTIPATQFFVGGKQVSLGSLVCKCAEPRRCTKDYTTDPDALMYFCAACESLSCSHFFIECPFCGASDEHRIAVFMNDPLCGNCSRGIRGDIGKCTGCNSVMCRRCAETEWCCSKGVVLFHSRETWKENNPVQPVASVASIVP